MTRHSKRRNPLFMSRGTKNCKCSINLESEMYTRFHVEYADEDEEQQTSTYLCCLRCFPFTLFQKKDVKQTPHQPPTDTPQYKAFPRILHACIHDTQLHCKPNETVCKIYACGNASDGQLGVSDDSSVITHFTIVKELSNIHIISIVCSERHCAALCG